MKFILIILAAAFSAPAYAQSPAEVISNYARVCHSSVGTQASIGLSQAYHAAEPGSQEEIDAKAALDTFNETLSSFVVFETGCNETFEGDEKFLCYSQGYSKETKRIMGKYSVEYAVDVKVTPECAYIQSAL